MIAFVSSWPVEEVFEAELLLWLDCSDWFRTLWLLEDVFESMEGHCILA